MLKKDLLILVAILFFNASIFAFEINKLTDYEIAIISQQNDSVYETQRTVEFRNTKTNSLVKSIDLIEDNPYNNLPFEKKKIEKGYVLFHRYLGLNLNDIFEDLSWMYPPVYTANKSRSIFWADSWSYCYMSKEVITIVYTLNVFSNPESMIGVKSSIMIFDEQGENIFKLDELTDALSSTITTENGKFFGYLHGQQLAEFPRFFKNNPGIKIYNTKTRILILDKNVPFDVELCSIFSRNDLIIYTTKIDTGLQNERRLTNIVDPEAKIVYSAVLKVDIQNRIKSYSSKGLILGKTSKQDNETEIFSFDKNFQKEEF